MAVVDGFEPHPTPTLRIQPSHTTCRYKISGEGKQRVIQLDTGGSKARENPGKVSQTLQLPYDQARALWELLGKEFGFSTK